MERFQWSKERRRRVVSHDLSSNTGVSSQEGAVARAFLTALESQDFHRMEACFHPDIHFRALVPAGVREGVGPQETVDLLQKWFGKADAFALMKAEVDSIANRWRIAYWIRLQRMDGWRVIEQQAFCTVKKGRIERMDVLCSGFLPAPEASYQVANRETILASWKRIESIG